MTVPALPGPATLLVLPFLVPLITAAASFLTWRSVRAQRYIGVAGAGLHLAVGVWLTLVVWREGIIVTQAGGWPAPFGITLVADYLSAVMVLLAGIVGFSVAVYAMHSVDVRRQAYGFYPLLHILLMGVSGAFLTGACSTSTSGSVMLIARSFLGGPGRERLQLRVASSTSLNLISSALFLAGLGLLTGDGHAEYGGSPRQVARSRTDRPRHHRGHVASAGSASRRPFSPCSSGCRTLLPSPAAVSAVFSGCDEGGGVCPATLCTLVFVQDVLHAHHHPDSGGTHHGEWGPAPWCRMTSADPVAPHRQPDRLHDLWPGALLAGRGGGVGLLHRPPHHREPTFLVSGVAQRLTGSYQLGMGGLYRSYPCSPSSS